MSPNRGQPRFRTAAPSTWRSPQPVPAHLPRRTMRRRHPITRHMLGPGVKPRINIVVAEIPRFTLEHVVRSRRQTAESTGSLAGDRLLQRVRRQSNVRTRLDQEAFPAVAPPGRLKRITPGARWNHQAECDDLGSAGGRRTSGHLPAYRRTSASETYERRKPAWLAAGRRRFLHAKFHAGGKGLALGADHRTFHQPERT
jgi:hypothetical protein